MEGGYLVSAMNEIKEGRPMRRPFLLCARVMRTLLVCSFQIQSAVQQCPGEDAEYGHLK